jgi:hypothetical protein
MSGEISTVGFEIAVMGTRLIRLANLPPEITGITIRTAPSESGEITSIQDEKWYKNYRYAVANAVKIVAINLPKPIPSHIAGYRALTAYDGQPQACYGCDHNDHMYHVCRKLRGAKPTISIPTSVTWPHIVAAKAPSPGNPNEYKTATVPNHHHLKQIQPAARGVEPGDSGPTFTLDAMKVSDTTTCEKHDMPVTDLSPSHP